MSRSYKRALLALVVLIAALLLIFGREEGVPPINPPDPDIGVAPGPRFDPGVPPAPGVDPNPGIPE